MGGALAVADAIAALASLINTAASLMDSAKQVSGIIEKARLEGREVLTEEEMQVIRRADDTSRQHLVDAITKALGK